MGSGALADWADVLTIYKSLPGSALYLLPISQYWNNILSGLRIRKIDFIFLSRGYSPLVKKSPAGNHCFLLNLV